MDCSDRVERVTSGGPDLYDLPDKDSFFKSLWRRSKSLLSFFRVFSTGKSLDRRHEPLTSKQKCDRWALVEADLCSVGGGKK